MDMHPIAGTLNSAAANLSTLARNIGTRSAKLRDSIQSRRASRQLMHAAEELRDAAHDAAESARHGAGPYARRLAGVARGQIEEARAHAKSGVSTPIARLEKRGVLARHPFAAALLVAGAGACFVAIRRLRNGKSHAASRSPAATAKASNGARSTLQRKRATAKKPRRSRASRQ